VSDALEVVVAAVVVALVVAGWGAAAVALVVAVVEVDVREALELDPLEPQPARMIVTARAHAAHLRLVIDVS
jgi:hypothetical protein